MTKLQPIASGGTRRLRSSSKRRSANLQRSGLWQFFSAPYRDPQSILDNFASNWFGEASSSSANCLGVRLPSAISESRRRGCTEFCSSGRQACEIPALPTATCTPGRSARRVAVLLRVPAAALLHRGWARRPGTGSAGWSSPRRSPTPLQAVGACGIAEASTAGGRRGSTTQSMLDAQATRAAKPNTDVRKPHRRLPRCGKRRRKMALESVVPSQQT
mmetsp:Transcript_60507/g.198055  ORF Transcript_60507/g.198055 Transcript_60507/m.198055 type:complete len:217 (-) Transcript_60507:6-656(-)